MFVLMFEYLNEIGLKGYFFVVYFHIMELVDGGEMIGKILDRFVLKYGCRFSRPFEAAERTLMLDAFD